MQTRLRAFAVAVVIGSGLGCGSEEGLPNDGTENVDPAPSAPAAPSAPSSPAPSSPAPSTPAPAAVDPNVISVYPEDLGKWQWLPIEKTSCADGTQAGIGINFTDASKELVVWFQGNGICYDLISCTMFKQMLVGMGPDPITHLFWDDANAALHGPFNREDPKNPFRNANFVVFPHCALDGHAANKDTNYTGIGTVHQHGYTNVTEALKRIVPTFKDASRITVAGFSAGGIGTVANYHQIAKAFEAVGQPPPFMIDDAGPVITKPWLSDSGQKALRKGWGLDSTFITFCPECATEGIHMIHEALWKAHPGMRSSLVSTYSDITASWLYRLIDKAPLVINTYHEGLVHFEEWAASQQAAVAPSKHRSFFRGGSAHGQIYPDFSANPDLADFIQGQLDDAPTWTSQVP